jgi:hypothetical protein
MYDAKRDWGAQLHIPLSFRTIETTVPAAIAQRPRMLYFPRREQWAENVVNVRTLIDAQQDQIDIDLPFQASCAQAGSTGSASAKRCGASST